MYHEIHFLYNLYEFPVKCLAQTCEMKTYIVDETG